MPSKTGLGKGLAALISEDSLETDEQAYIPNLPVDNIKPNPYQPRVEIKPETLVELTDSLREYGVIEPLIVKRISPSEFELIAGERRLRAAQMANIETVPVVIMEASPQQMLELAIVENIQRADLNPLEEALAFKQLVDKFKLSHGEVSAKVGYSRPAIANKIRLLELPEEVKKGLLQGKLSEGHARALLGLKTEEDLLQTYKIILREGISVRATEELVRRINAKKKNLVRTKTVVKDTKTAKMENTLRRRFGEKVSLNRSSRGGKIIIPFKGEKEFTKIYKKLTK